MKRRPEISASTSALPRRWVLPFQRMERQFFGDMHGQGRDAIEFYTDKKVVAALGEGTLRKSVSRGRKVAPCEGCGYYPQLT